MDHITSITRTDIATGCFARSEETSETLGEVLTARNAQLEAAVRELTAFSHAVSHDLRAPLRHIAGFADLLEAQDGAQLSEKGRRHLATIQRSARAMDTLIDQLADFSRWGVADLRLGTVDLAALVPEIIAELSPEPPPREIHWVLGPLPRVRADPGLLKRALANLIGNAVKFTRPRASSRIELGCRQEGGATELCIQDNGIGFNPEYGSRLFGLFQRLHADPQLVGAGMGLAQVRRIIERHGGRVWAESDGMAGAAFFLTLPA